jgi:hypothetical protein
VYPALYKDSLSSGLVIPELSKKDKEVSFFLFASSALTCSSLLLNSSSVIR